jgi:thiol-disulfide isomerase/thioredoxin
MRPPARLLTLLVPIGLAMSLCGALAGCSATSGSRNGAVSNKMKTYLSVGDKPLPVVSGEPGSTVTADAGADDQPSPASGRVRPDGRISGRVYDADGRPVPEARVRLAVGGAPGGKVVSATTDRSGAFTLHGLRPGSSYTVIAEWEGDDGAQTGRAEARTAETNVRIRLASPGDPPARASAPSRVNRVSGRAVTEPDEDEADDPGDRRQPGGAARTPGRVNEEDLPPAAEAEAVAPVVSSAVRDHPDAPASPRSNSRSVAWRRGSRGRDDPGGAQGEPARPELESTPGQPGARAGSEPSVAPIDPEARGTAAPVGEPPAPLDDIPNPLPPALERVPDQASATVPEPSPAPPDPPRVAAGGPAPDPSTMTRRPAASLPFESTRGRTGSRKPEAAAEPLPGALVVAPKTEAPTDPEPDPVASTPPVAPEPSPAAARPRPRPDTAPRPLAARVPPRKPASAEGGSADPDRRRPTWGEVAATVPSPPPLEGEAVAENAPVKVDPNVARRGLETRSTVEAAPERLAGASGPVKGPVKPACDYDDRHRRILDFRLPDLNGNPVRFHDLDADLVLIDFWGTWCPPCLRSIPHLIELQEKLGRRLAVIGIACEPDAPEKSAAKVAETARRLNINYPVLLSRNDGSCPLQEALHIQAFPTMVLVDREGRVLWRDQGATPATLARLDRILAAAPAPDATRRY